MHNNGSDLSVIDLISGGSYGINNNISDGGDDSIQLNVTMSIEEFYTLHLPAITAMNRYVTLLWYAIGYPGNLLSFAVWIQPRMRHSSGCYLAALATADFLFLMLHLVYTLQISWNVMVLQRHFVCEAFPVFFYTTQYISPLLVLAFSVERYISICHPFHRERFCTMRRAIGVVATVSCSMLLLNVVQGYFWRYDEPSNDCGIREEVANNNVWAMWSWVTELLVFLAVPLAILGFNLCVIVETCRIKAKEEKLLNGNRRRSVFAHKPSATTVTLLVVSLFHIATTLPVTVCYVMNFTIPPGDLSLPSEAVAGDVTWQRHLSYAALRYIVYTVCMSHYAGNFLIYVATGASFRQELRRLVRRWAPCCVCADASTDSFEMTAVTTDGTAGRPSGVAVNGYGRKSTSELLPQRHGNHVAGDEKRRATFVSGSNGSSRRGSGMML